MRRCLFVSVLVLVPLAAAESAVAQKAPEIGYVYPSGGSAGQTIDVKLGGYDWTPDMQTFCLDTPATISITGRGSKMLVPKPPYWFGPKANSAKAFLIAREFPAKFTIPVGMPPGPIFWQVANANGTSKTGVFVVGVGPELIEDQHRFEPQRLGKLPVVVHGRIMRIEEVDQYVLSVPKTTLVTCDLMARRLGSPLHGVIEVHDSHGTAIADAVDTQGVDTSVTFRAQAGVEYTVSLHDLDFRGNRAYVYRLTMTTGLHVLATIPAVGRRSTSIEFELIGIGLETGQTELETVRRSIEIPSTRKDAYRGTLTLQSGAKIDLEIPVSDIPETVRAMNSDNPEKLSAPCGVTARFGGSDQHRYKIMGSAGAHWTITAQAWRFGAGLDLSLAIFDPAGKELATNDDLAGTTDAGLDIVLPADGEYTIIVTDTSIAQDSPTSIYRLAIEHPSPDFKLAIPQTATVKLGGEYQLSVTLQRVAEFDGAVAISVSGLPDGVTAPETIMIEPGKTEVKIPLKSDNQAAVSAALLTVTGRSTVGGRAVVRVAKATANGNPLPRVAADNEVSAMLLAVTMKPRAEVAPANSGVSRTAHRGTTYPAKIVVKRLEGFDGPVTVRMSAYQQRHRQGMNASDVIVPSGVEQSIFPCYLPEWLETNRTSRMRMTTVIEVPDPQGNIRHLVNYQDAAVSLSLEGALLKVKHAAEELSATPGQHIEIPIDVLRAVKLRVPVRLELVAPAGLKGCLQADTVELPVDRDRIVFKVQTKLDPRLYGMRTFEVRATAMQDGKYPAVSQTTVEVFFESPNR